MICKCQHIVADIQSVHFQCSWIKSPKTSTKQHEHVSNEYWPLWLTLNDKSVYLFENNIHIVLQLNGCVRIVKLAKHNSLRCNNRAKQLHNDIWIDFGVFVLHTNKTKTYQLFGKCKCANVKSIQKIPTTSFGMSSCFLASSCSLWLILSFNWVKMMSFCWSNTNKPSIILLFLLFLLPDW